MYVRVCLVSVSRNLFAYFFLSSSLTCWTAEPGEGGWGDGGGVEIDGRAGVGLDYLPSRPGIVKESQRSLKLSFDPDQISAGPGVTAVVMNFFCLRVLRACHPKRRQG